MDLFPALNVIPRWFAPWKKIANKVFKFSSVIHLRDYDTGLASKSWNWTKEIAGKGVEMGMKKLELSYEVGMVSANLYLAVLGN